MEDADQVAAALRASVGHLVRRLRQTRVEGELTLPQSTALSRLDRGGATTSAELARAARISPQSMGATLAVLERRGLIERAPDPGDGRRVLLSVTDAGREVLGRRRAAREERLAEALAAEFTPEELDRLAAAAPLLERLGDRL